jgi:hypothetical protein
MSSVCHRHWPSATCSSSNTYILHTVFSHSYYYWTVWPSRWKHCDLLTCQELHAYWHDVTSWQTWMFSSTAARFSNFALFILFQPAGWQMCYRIVSRIGHQALCCIPDVQILTKSWRWRKHYFCGGRDVDRTIVWFNFEIPCDWFHSCTNLCFVE